MPRTKPEEYVAMGNPFAKLRLILLYIIWFQEHFGEPKGRDMMMSLWLNEMNVLVQLKKNMRGFIHRLAKAYTPIYDVGPLRR